MMMTQSPLNSLAPVPGQLLAALIQLFVDNRSEAWLVGGAVRDLLSGGEPLDFDIAFAGNLTPMIKFWAGRNQGRWFWLDKERNQSRVVFVDKGLQFDFSALRAPDIYQDLGLRDFTVNALAAALTGPTPLRDVIDPLGGQDAIKAGLLKGCGPGVFLDDPLRVLKGVRHFAERGWQLDAETGQLFRVAVPKLRAIAGERLKSELGKILASPRLAESVALLHAYGMLDEFFPGMDQQGLAAQLDCKLLRISQFMPQNPVTSRLKQRLEEDVSLRALLFFAVLWLRMPQGPEAQAVVKRFCFSNSCRSLLNALQFTPSIPVPALNSGAPRVQALQLEAFGTHCVELLIFTLLQAEGDDFDGRAVAYIDAYLNLQEKGQVKHLLDGKRLLLLTQLMPGPEIGDLQKRIKAAEIAGEISDEDSAINWLRRRFSD